jgi:hypothetical protein
LPYFCSEFGRFCCRRRGFLNFHKCRTIIFRMIEKWSYIRPSNSVKVRMYNIIQQQINNSRDIM